MYAYACVCVCLSVRVCFKATASQKHEAEDPIARTIDESLKQMKQTKLKRKTKMVLMDINIYQVLKTKKIIFVVKIECNTKIAVSGR